MQLAALLGALGDGLHGDTAYSIFGDISGEISSRQQTEYERRLAMAKMQQDALEAHNKGLSSLTDFLLKSGPDARTTTVTGPSGVTTTTSQNQVVPFPELQTELGALASTVPGGLSTDEQARLGALADQLYTLPSMGGTMTDDKGIVSQASPKQALGHFLGNPGAPVIQLPDFWRGVRSATEQGIAKGRKPQEIVAAIAQRAASMGFGSAPEQQEIAQTVGQLIQSRGYGGAPPTAAPGQGGAPASGGSGTPLIGGLIDAALGALATAGVVKGVKYARGSTNPFGRGMQGSIEDYQGGPQTGRVRIPVSEHVPGELAQGAARPALPATASETSLVPRQLAEGQSLESAMGLGGGRAAGMAEGAAGFMGALGIPLAVLDMTVGQSRREDAEQSRMQEWSNLSDAEKHAAYQGVIANGTMDPRKDSFDWRYGVVIKDTRGGVIDPQTGNVEIKA